MNYLNNAGIALTPIYPFIEKIKFYTEVIALSSLKQADIGTPVRFDTQSNMPLPSYSIVESIIRDVIVSENNNVREQRRPRFETSLRRYKLHFDAITATAASAVKTFFVNRKGRFNNFSIQETEISPYTEYSLFEGNLTTVNFDSDILVNSMVSPGRFTVDIPIIESSNSIRIPLQLNPYREFIINYSTEDLTDIINFFEDNAVGKDVIFDFNPYNMISSYLSNTTYTVRIDIELFEREIRQINQDMVSIILKEVIT